MKSKHSSKLIAMKRYILIIIAGWVGVFASADHTFAQNADDEIRIKIDADIDGQLIKLDTLIQSLSDFNIDAFLKDLGIENELQQLNIDINNGDAFDFNWDETAFQNMMDSIKLPPMPPLPPLPPMPNAESFSFNSNKAFLGVHTEKISEGAKITSVIENTPAAEVGLIEGDIIIKIDDRTIESPSNLSEVIGLYEPGFPIKITFLRKGNTETITATLKENEKYRAWEKFDSVRGFNWNEDRGNLFEIKSRAFLGVYLDENSDNAGVLISGIEENSAAEESGLKTGDILTEIDGKKVGSYEEVVNIISSKNPGGKITLTYLREGKTYEAEATLKEKKVEFHHFKMNDKSKEEGHIPNIIIDRIMPCQPGSSYSFNSTDGNKNVNIAITIIKRDDVPPATAIEERSATNYQHPLMNSDNLSIYSNPTESSFNVRFSLPVAGNTNITITDSNGREVYTQTLTNFSGIFDKSISLGDNAKGTYFVKVSQQGYSSSKTVVLQ
jgi:membrane-associated protease RseP (regulator of RpoE activity)